MEQRTIKFKAKRLDNSEWAKGDLLHSYEGGVILVPIEGGGVFSVDPSTVCQFTGLKDTDGKDIWEGDILEREIPKGVNAVKRSTVEFYEGHFTLGYDLTYPLGYTLCDWNFRVIGNKFDRKEEK